MRIAFRTDASVEIGSGHLMRCLTLAEQLSSMGCEIAFICRDLPGAMFPVIGNAGYSYRKLANYQDEVSQELDANETILALSEIYPDGTDWMVVDHYKLDSVWEKLIRQHVKRILVIDDIANRPHDCDLLLDQNYYHNPECRYKDLVPSHARILLGPAYVLLRKEFIDARLRLRKRSDGVKTALVFFGGSDPTNQTQKVIEAFRSISYPNLKIDVVVGMSNPNHKAIQNECALMANMNFHCQVSNMAELISNADFAVGAGGAAMWERCYLGLPTITVVFAENQEQITKDVASTGAIDYLGWANELDTADYVRAISELVANTERLHKMSCAATKLVGSCGPYLAQTMLELEFNKSKNGLPSPLLS